MQIVLSAVDVLLLPLTAVFYLAGMSPRHRAQSRKYESILRALDTVPAEMLRAREELKQFTVAVEAQQRVVATRASTGRSGEHVL